MPKPISTESSYPEIVRVITEPVLPKHPLEAGVHDRHSLIPDFDQSALGKATVDIIGAGAGSEAARALAKKGVGVLRIFDPDPAIELSNLPRQAYYRDQLYQPKATVLPQNLAKETTAAACIEGHAARFEEAVASGQETSCHAAVVLVDSNATRAFCSIHFRKLGVPCILAAFSENADRAYVFVQEASNGPCFGCVFPEQAKDDTSFPCAGATIDLPEVVAGIVGYVVDSLLMPRKRYWNYREISLSGVTDDIVALLPRRPDCPLCR